MIKIPEKKLFKKTWLKVSFGILLIAILVAGIAYYKFSADTVDYPKYFGCQNTADAKCIHFINNSENGITISNPSYLGAVDGTFRPILTKKTVTISVPAFNVDDTGFPASDMMLEVKYKDTVVATTSSMAQILQEIDYGSSKFQTTAALSLGDKGLGDTKIEQALFEKNEWQRLRAINGQFIFQLTGASADMPIEYFSLYKISSADKEGFKKWQRDVYKNLTEVKHTETNPIPTFNGDFALYTSSTSKQIFPNSIPAAEEIDKDVNISTALGEYEPIPISVYTKKSLNNVSVSISDLSSSVDKIPKEAIDVRKVVYDYKVWTNNTYAMQPDRIEKFNNINISANNSQQFWLTANVPNTLAGGSYTGTITVQADNVQQKTIKVTLDVLPIKLKNSKPTNAIYFAPQNKTFALKNDAVFADMKAHEINSLIDSPKTITIAITDGVLSFDTSVIKANLQESANQGVLLDTMLYSNIDYSRISIISKLNSYYSTNGDANITIDGQTFSNSPRWQDYGSVDDVATNWKKINDPRFIKAFELVIKQMISEGKSVNSANGGIKMLFLAIDEPSEGKLARAYSDREYRYIREVGGQTWVTYNDACKKEVECPECQPCAECTIKDGKTYLPSLADLIDNKAYSMYPITAANVEADQSTFGFYDTYYSQLRNPVSNRFIHGIFAEKAGAKVTAIYAYGDYSSDPFNDFDSEYLYKYPDFLLVYPTWNPDGEVIPTMAWEALREGIKDAKYIETLKDLITKYPNSDISKEASAYLNNTLSKVSLDWQSTYRIPAPNSELYISQILQTVSATGSATDYTAFDTIRNKTIQYIKDLSPETTPITPPSTDATDKSDTDLVAFDNFQSGWNMVTFPQATTLLTGKDLPSTFKIRKYNPGTNSYDKLEGSSIQLMPGVGYWIKTDDLSKLNNLKYKPQSSTTNEVSVSKGWNFLGNPFDSNLPLSNLKVKYKDGSVKSYADAVTKGDVVGYVWSYESKVTPKQYYFVSANPNKYKTTAHKETFIGPLRGFWMIIKNKNIANIIMNK